MNNKTLEQLEHDYWGEPEESSYLVEECHRLRKVPIKEFDSEDLRLMIGQNIGLAHLLPRAINVLLKNPLAQGDYYPGDLLHAVLRANQINSEQVTQLKTILGKLETVPKSIQSEATAFLKRHP